MKPICKINDRGDKEWLVDGYLHREDGPAYEYFDGTTEWHYEDNCINCEDNSQFLRMVKLMVFL